MVLTHLSQDNLHSAPTRTTLITRKLVHLDLREVCQTDAGKNYSNRNSALTQDVMTIKMRYSLAFMEESKRYSR